MEVKGLKCKKCKDIIFSRARHDMHRCSCGEIGVDGGLDYLKIIGTKYNVVVFEIDATEEELYNDWVKQKNKFGVHEQTDRKIKNLKELI